VTAGAEIVLDHVRKGFEDGRISALEDVSLRIEPGEFVSLTGPSGSGKSTLLNLVGALDRPDAGTVTVGGQRVDALDDPADYRAQVVGFVFQFHNLISTLSAQENVQIPMMGRGLARSERVERADELLREAAVAHRATSYPPTMSGGERQRVAIARALANGPRVLLADEPTGALDSETGAQILALLERLRAERQMTILLVTNDEAVARRADRTLHLRDGRVTLVEGPRSE
jgi:putative ABC transport system ATP-binding protein